LAQSRGLLLKLILSRRGRWADAGLDVFIEINGVQFETSKNWYHDGNVGDIDPGGLVTKIVNTINGLPSLKYRFESGLSDDRNALARVNKKIGAPFEHAKELSEKIAEATQLERELAEEGEDIPSTNKVQSDRGITAFSQQQFNDVSLSKLGFSKSEKISWRTKTKVTAEDGRAYILEDLAASIHKAGMSLKEFLSKIANKLGNAFNKVKDAATKIYHAINAHLDTFTSGSSVGAITLNKSKSDKAYKKESTDKKVEEKIQPQASTDKTTPETGKFQKAFQAAQDFGLAVVKPEKIQGTDKKDLNLLERIFSVLSHWKGKDKTADKIIDVILGKAETRAEQEHSLFNSTGGVKGDFDHFKDGLLPLYKKDKPGYQRLQKYIQKHDIARVGMVIRQDGEKWIVKSKFGKQIGKFDNETEAEQFAIKKEVDQYKGSDLEKQALQSYRNITINVFHKLRESWDQVVSDALEAGEPIPQVVIESPDGNVQVDIDVALKKMGDLRMKYFPRLRQAGTYQVYATKSGANPKMKFFDTKTMAGAYLNSLKREGYTGSIKKAAKLPESVFSDMTKTVADLALVNKSLSSIPEYKRTLAHVGFKGTWRGDDFILSGPIEEGMDSFLEMMGGEFVEEIKNNAYRPKFIFKDAKAADKNIEQSITNALFRYKGFAPTLNKQFASDMVRAVSDEIKGHGNRSRMITRSEATGKDVALGYEEDLLTATAMLAAGTAGSEAKRQVAKKGYQLLLGQEQDWEQFQANHSNEQQIQKLEQTLNKMLLDSVVSDRKAKELKKQAAKLRRKLYKNQFSTLKEAQNIIDEINSLNEQSKQQYSDQSKANKIKKQLRVLRSAVWEDYLDMIESSKIDPVQQPGMYDELSKAIKDVLRNNDAVDRAINKVRAATVFYFLAGRVSSAAVNLTNLGFGVPGRMKAAGIGFAQAGKNIGKGLELYRRYKFSKDRLDDDHLALFNAISEKGLDEPKLNVEAFEAMQSQFGKAWAKTMEVLMKGFSVTEQINRAGTVSGAYLSLVDKKGLNVTDKNGDIHADLLKEAKDISDDAHGVYQPANRPSWMKGESPATRMIAVPYIFNTFTHNYLLTMGKLGWNGIKEMHLKNPGSWKNDRIQGALWMAFAPTILGIGSSLGTKAIINTIGKLMGSDDPEDDFYRYLDKNFGPTAERFARYGASGFLEHGADMTGSLRIGLPSGGMGAFGGMVDDIWSGTKNLTKGFYWEAAEDFAPAFIQNPIEAVRKYKKGTTTYSGAPVLYEGKKVQHDIIDVIIESFSFRPSREALKLDKRYGDRKIKAIYSDFRSDIYKRIKGFYLSPPHKRNPKDKAKIIKLIREYNMRVRDKRLKQRGIPFITSKSIKSSLNFK
jgi:hypothetical protein